MNKLFRPNLYVALIHYPVVNKKGQTIASAVTNLDLHDIARIAKTYALQAFFVITPLTDQQGLVKKIIAHWTQGAGAAYNPQRRQALKLIRVCDALEDAATYLCNIHQKQPIIVATAAKARENPLSFSRLRRMLTNGDPYLLVFGTAWGLSEQALAAADCVLAPITGPSEYNHLSVRAAAAIILDRLLTD